MPSAFGHIRETIRRTGSPRILKPANVYCHLYSAEHPVRLRTLQKLIEAYALYEAEGDAKDKALNSLIEPVMIVFVGTMVGFIVISMYLPIFSLYDKIR